MQLNIDNESERFNALENRKVLDIQMGSIMEPSMLICYSSSIF